MIWINLSILKILQAWVHTSKDYGCPNLSFIQSCPFSPANNNSKFSDIFDSDKGVCLDAAVITTAMLRTAGIPSYPMLVDGFHIVTIYYLEGKWYSIDTTFCRDKKNCQDLVFLTSEHADKRIYLIYNRLGHFKDMIKINIVKIIFAWIIHFKPIK